MRISPEQIQEMRDLIDSGDLNLTERRKTFAKIAGRETNLNDAQLLVAIAATTDDDDELFMLNVIKVEHNEIAYDPELIVD